MLDEVIRVCSLVYDTYNKYLLSVNIKSVEIDLIFGVRLNFRPTKNIKSFVFYCFDWRMTKISTGYILGRLLLYQ